MNVISDNEDQEPMTIEDYRQINDWPKWKDEIQEEIDLLA